MNLLRLLLLAAAAWLIARLWRSARPPVRRPPDAGTTPRPPPEAATYEPMARCSRCGAHVPQSALSAGLCQRCRE